MRPLDWKEISAIMGFPIEYFGPYVQKAEEGPYRQRLKAQRDIISQLGNSIALPMAHGIMGALIETQKALGGYKNKTLVEICCGIGALSDGAKENGFEILNGIDIDDHNNGCLEVYKYNFGVGTKKSVMDYNFKKYKGKLGTLVGGPPCQPYSSGGHEKGTGDARDLCKSLDLFVGECLPDTFLFEEAPTLTKSAKHAVFVESLVAKFRALGYHTEVWLVDVASFDVPSSRERTIFFGFKKGKHSAEHIQKTFKIELMRQTKPLETKFQNFLLNESELLDLEGLYQSLPAIGKWYDWPWETSMKPFTTRGSLFRKTGGMESQMQISPKKRRVLLNQNT
jgi:site-specific DNA-cytosine methylase